MSYEPNYLTPEYETSASAADSSDPSAPGATTRAAEPGASEAPAEAPSGAGSSPSSGPDFSSAYETLDEPTGPSVYDEGYVTPTPAPVVETGYQLPTPNPVSPQHLPQPMPHHVPQPMGPPSYGYGANIAPYQAPYPMQPYPYHAQVVPEHPTSTTIGVMGLASFAIGLTAPFAWYMGAKAKREIARGAPYRLSGLAQVGYVVGVIYTIFGFLGLALMVLGIIIG